MKKVRLDIIGNKYNRLTVLSFSRISNNKSYWNCLCDCGNQREVLGISLTVGNTKSCGCIKSINRLTHGMSKTVEYSAWLGIIKRTENKNRSDYKDYGGRGIKVCDRWRNSFENFLSDMGLRPSPKHSIERLNNNGNYTKLNCKWATKHEQSRNKRNNVYVKYKNSVMILQDWANHFGIVKESMKDRIARDKNYKIL